MAQECGAVIGAIDLVKGRHLDSSTIDELDYARNQLECICLFLAKLEEIRPENTISTQLGALFQQAHDDFSKICNHMNKSYTITKVHKMIKPENIAERLTAASNLSGMILEVLKILKPDNIAERIKASKPSTSSSRITTMEMVSRCIEHVSMQYFFTHVENVAYTALQLHIYKPLDSVKVIKIRDYIEVRMAIEYSGTPLKEFTSLQSLIEALAFEVAFVIYSYDEDLLFVLQPKLNHVNAVIELIQLRNSQETMTDPLKDLFDYAWEELIVVRTFLMDSLEQCKQQNKITDFLELIQFVTYEVQTCSGCKKQNSLLTGFGTIAIEAESVNSNKSRKSNLVLQFLTLVFQLIKCERRLMDILKHKATLEAHILDLIESAHEELIYLRVLLIDVLRQHTQLDELHHVLMHAEVTANKIAQIIEGRSIKEIGHLLSEIESVKVEVKKVCFHFLDASPYSMTDGEGLITFLLKHQDWMLNYDACSIPFLKNHIPVIKDKLVFLGSFIADIVQHRDMHQELKDLVKRVQDIKFVCLFHIWDFTPSWYYRLYVFDIKRLLKFVETEVKMICLKFPDSSSYSYPKINELGFLDCFLGKLDEMLSSKLESVINLKRQVGPLREGLLCLRTLTDHFPEIYDEHDGVYSLITRVTAMAYKAEYAMDSCLTYSYPLWYKVLWISEAVENIKLLNEVVKETCERKKIDVTVHKVKKTSTYLEPFTGEDSFPEMSMDYRVFVHSSEDQIDLWQPSRSNVRSLLFNVIDSDNLLLPHNISSIFDSFKLVKYFAAKTGGNSIPSCIANLWNLKTFVLRGMGGEVILPSSLLKMVKIRNIHVTHRASFSLHENMGESLADSQLDNLETFSTPHFSYGEDTEMILRKMPKLRKLSCVFSGTFGYSEEVKGRCVLYPRLEFLCQLESLKVVSNSYPGKLPHVFSFPSRLRELTLSKFRLPWSQILSIGELPNLKILKLLLRAFEGDEWEVKDSEFRELKYLVSNKVAQKQ
ncbi:hypothetical protein KY284_025533 [Solanum tuberosum]|nr:hypothetical protein KY284_025533 [Solanum tuberosum]